MKFFSFSCKVIKNRVRPFFILSHRYVEMYYIHTYITTLQLGLLTQFLTSLMLCVLILYINGGMCSLNPTPNGRFFEKLFMAIFDLLSEFMPEICRKKIAEETLFVFYFHVWPGAQTLALRLICQHTTYWTTAT